MGCILPCFSLVLIMSCRTALLKSLAKINRHTPHDSSCCTKTMVQVLSNRPCAAAGLNAGCTTRNGPYPNPCTS